MGQSCRNPAIPFSPKKPIDEATPLLLPDLSMGPEVYQAGGVEGDLDYSTKNGLVETWRPELGYSSGAAVDKLWPACRVRPSLICLYK